MAPIHLDGGSLFKSGSTIPVKFKLAGASDGIVLDSVKLYAGKVSDAILGTEIEASSTSAADSGNTFRYDASTDEYVFNLATKALNLGTWQLRADLGDGVKHTVLVSLK